MDRVQAAFSGMVGGSKTRLGHKTGNQNPTKKEIYIDIIKHHYRHKPFPKNLYSLNEFDLKDLALECAKMHVAKKFRKNRSKAETKAELKAYYTEKNNSTPIDKPKNAKGTRNKINEYKKLNQEEFNETYDEREAAVRIEKAGYHNSGKASYNYWICKGKYYGIPMSKLPLHYLRWVINTFDDNTVAFQYAKHEIEKRFSRLPT